MNIKTGKVLGVGYVGTVFKSVLDGQPVVGKIEKYDGDDSTASGFIRQIKFNDFAKHHPDKFMTVVSYSVKEDCEFKQTIPDGIDKDSKKKLIARNKLPLCCMLFYTPILDITYDKIAAKLTDEQWIDCLLQTSKAVKLMSEAGFIHRDIHGGNLMAKKLGDGKYQWYIIDYGLVWHKSFKPNEADQELKDRKYDIIGLAFTLVRNKAFDYYIKNELKISNYVDALKFIKNHERFELIKQYLPRIRNVEETNNLIFLFTLILDYPLYMESWSMTPNKRLLTVQPDPKLLIRLLSDL